MAKKDEVIAAIEYGLPAALDDGQGGRQDGCAGGSGVVGNASEPVVLAGGEVLGEVGLRII